MKNTLKGIGRGLAVAAIAVVATAAGTLGYLGFMALLPVALVLYPVCWLLHTARMGRRCRRTSAQLLAQSPARRSLKNDVKAFARTRRG
jgi:fatty acid desaturase